MSVIAVVHVALEIWGIILCFVAALCVYMGRNVDHKVNMRLLQLQIFNAFLLCMDVLAWIFRGREGRLGFYMVRISNGAVFFLSCMMMLAFYRYATCLIDREKGVAPGWNRVVYGMVVADLLCCVLNQFNHMYYYFDEHNYYHRTEGTFWISHAFGIAFMILFAIMLWCYRKNLSCGRKWALVSYSILPFVAMVIQTFFYGLALLNIAITISVLWAFLSAQVEYMLELIRRTDELVEQERKNNDMQIKIVLSQIQPHFLYNVLNTIYYLCGTDSRTAQMAVSQFSDYLRGNLDSLKSSVPIPVEDELEHVKNYLLLEKLRFSEELNIVYDVQVVGFMLPALSIQPLVENAVKYGIGKKIGGGTVMIATREKEDCYEVSITDDGVGFEPGRKQEDGCSHIGIENVRTRLRLMCNGTLEIDARPGKGTRACIRLPKAK